MTDNVFVAIDADALKAKSAVYISRALTHKTSGSLDEYQLWASLALELLGKAALASVHPTLIVDPTHWQSLFVAAGVKVTTDVKTITAKTLFERLNHVVPGFDNKVQTFCQGISQRRNAELHSADIPFRTMKLEAWEARYWHACNVILAQIGLSLEEWLGANDAAAPRQVLEEAAQALKAAVQVRVSDCASRFEDLKKADRERLSQEALQRVPMWQTNLFTQFFDDIWSIDCPACGCRAFIAGDQTGEEIIEGRDDDAMWEVVEREFEAEEFRCPSCELSLDGSEEFAAAGLNTTYQDEQEREMDYEPDYGND